MRWLGVPLVALGVSGAKASEAEAAAARPHSRPSASRRSLLAIVYGSNRGGPPSRAGQAAEGGGGGGGE